MDEIQIKLNPKLPKGERQARNQDIIQVHYTLPAMTVEMIERKAKEAGKTRAAYVNYLIWCGYHALQGTFKQPEKQSKKG